MHDLRCDRFITEHVRKLAERLLQDGDFPYEDITGQDEPPTDSPLVPGEKREVPARTNQQYRLLMLPYILHDKRQWETMMTGDDEPASLGHLLHQLFNVKLGY